MPKHDFSDHEWWSAKITKITDVDWRKSDPAKVFNRQVGHWAIDALNGLKTSPRRKVTGAGIAEISTRLGVPKKYGMRVLGLLERLGLVLVDFDENEKTVEVWLRRVGEKPIRKRKPISQAQRIRLLEAEGYKCGHCRCRLELTMLRVDHIIPFSVLGADHPGNWGALCNTCNRKKWHNFDRYWLKSYRNRPVSGVVGVRLKNGQLWPLINGKLCIEKRAGWTEKERD